MFATAFYNPAAKFLDAIVVGQALYKVGRLASLDKFAPGVFVLGFESEVFFDGATRPYPDSLAAEFSVDAPKEFYEIMDSLTQE